MTKEKFIEILKLARDLKASYTLTPEAAVDVLEALEQPQWIPIKMRKLTEEEKQELKEDGWEEGSDEAWDCPLPEDGQEVLIATLWGVTTDTFCASGYAMGFENYDSDQLKAWMPMPEYKEVENDG